MQGTLKVGDDVEVIVGINATIKSTCTGIHSSITPTCLTSLPLLSLCRSGNVQKVAGSRRGELSLVAAVAVVVVVMMMMLSWSVRRAVRSMPV